MFGHSRDDATTFFGADASSRRAVPIVAFCRTAGYGQQFCIAADQASDGGQGIGATTSGFTTGFMSMAVWVPKAAGHPRPHRIQRHRSIGVVAWWSR